MRHILILCLFLGCGEVDYLAFTEAENYTIQVDNFGRYRILLPDGEDVGARFDTFYEATLAVELAVEMARNAILKEMIDKRHRDLDNAAEWVTVGKRKEQL